MSTARFRSKVRKYVVRTHQKYVSKFSREWSLGIPPASLLKALKEASSNSDKFEGIEGTIEFVDLEMSRCHRLVKLLAKIAKSIGILKGYSGKYGLIIESDPLKSILSQVDSANTKALAYGSPLMSPLQLNYSDEGYDTDQDAKDDADELKRFHHEYVKFLYIAIESLRITTLWLGNILYWNTEEDSIVKFISELSSNSSITSPKE